jgi:type IV pilus assembly protein PilO
MGMKAIRDKLRKMNPRHATILIFLVPVILIAAFIYFVYLPYQKSNDALDLSIQQNESEITKSQVMERKLTELKAANVKLQEDLKNVTAILPGADEAARFPDTVTDMVKASGLTFKSATPGQQNAGPSGLYFETPIAVEFSGSYHDVGKFMEGIDNITRLVAVSDFNMSSATMDGKRMNIPVKMTILAYTAGGGK